MSSKSEEKRFPPRLAVESKYEDFELVLDAHYSIYTKQHEKVPFKRQEYISLEESDALRAADRERIKELESKLAESERKLESRKLLDCSNANILAAEIEAKELAESSLANSERLRKIAVEVLNLSKTAIEAMSTTQVRGGLGIIGSIIVAPETLRKIHWALAQQPEGKKGGSETE